MGSSWDKYFLNIAKEVSNKSKDPSTKIGCVIANLDNIIVSVGFNGFPMRVADDLVKNKNRYERQLKYMYTVHGELNAISLAARTGAKLDKCNLYITASPCHECAKAIIQAGIKEVIVEGRNPANDNLDIRWKESMGVAKEMFKEAGIGLRLYIEGA